MDVLRRYRWRALLLILVLFSATVGAAQAQQEQPVANVVLFYSPACPHCEDFITNDLPKLYDRYDGQLKVIGVNTMESEGWALYQAAADHFAIPDERRGVPTVIVRDVVLVGGPEINNQLPPIIDAGLAEGGIPLPNLPELRTAVQKATADAAGAASSAETVGTNSSEAAPSQTAQADVTLDTLEPTALSPLELFARDPAGNTLAVVVLVALLAALLYAVDLAWRAFARDHVLPFRPNREWLVPVLAIAGLAIAGYLLYVETQNVEAICGPVGDCNTVQQSAYARLFGVVPVGALGAVGYAIILGLWAWSRMSRDNRRAALSELGLLGVVVAATLFSVYLTFLEPFVIGATCAWCLTSAVIVTALLVITARPGIRAGQAIVKRQA